MGLEFFAWHRQRAFADGERLGRHVAFPTDGNAVVGSTDMGNVSYQVPAIHPMIAVAPALPTEAVPVVPVTPAAPGALAPGA